MKAIRRFATDAVDRTRTDRLKAQMKPAFKELAEQRHFKQSSESLVAVKDAQTFPFALLSGTCRDLNKKPVSMKGFETTLTSPSCWVVTQKRLFSNKAVEGWLQLFDSDVTLRSVDLFELVLVDDPVWKWFGPLLEYGMRNSVAESKRQNFFHHYGYLHTDVIKTLDGLKFQTLPYVFLLDRARRIRWRSIGAANADDAQQLPHYAATLLGETRE